MKKDCRSRKTNFLQIQANLFPVKRNPTSLQLGSNSQFPLNENVFPVLITSEHRSDLDADSIRTEKYKFNNTWPQFKSIITWGNHNNTPGSRTVLNAAVLNFKILLIEVSDPARYWTRFLVVKGTPGARYSDKLRYYIGWSCGNAILPYLFIFIISPLAFIAHCCKSSWFMVSLLIFALLLKPVKF